MPEPNLIFTFFILIILELILGFDNVLMVSIISQRVEEKKQNIIRILGLILAALNRIALVFFISLFTTLEKKLFILNDLDVSIKDIIFFVGGSFLIWKSFREIYITIEIKNNKTGEKKSDKIYSVLTAVFQIIAIDAVFSIDSIITAIGFTDNLVVIVSSILISVLFMLLLVNKINLFIKNNVQIKILGLGFMFIIGVVLFLEVFDTKIPKYYLGITLVFALLVQLLQLRYKENKKKSKRKIFIRAQFKKTL